MKLNDLLLTTKQKNSLTKIAYKLSQKGKSPCYIVHYVYDLIKSHKNISDAIKHGLGVFYTIDDLKLETDVKFKKFYEYIRKDGSIFNDILKNKFLNFTYDIKNSLRENRDKLQEIIPQISNSSKELSMYYHRKTYFTYKDYIKWKTNYEAIYEELKKIVLKDLDLTDNQKEEIKKFHKWKSHKKIWEKRNDNFIKKELEDCDWLFSNVEGHSLDIQQRRAVITDEINNLIIAGAGSGKTTTVVGKIKYLVERHNIEPSKILLISFTSKSVKELKNRIPHDDIKAHTFHSFGRHIIHVVEKRPPSVFDEQFEFYINRFINELVANDSSYVKNFTNFLLRQLNPKKKESDFKNHGDYIQYLREYNIRPLKKTPVNINGKITMMRQKVKSLQECNIADFLFLHRVDYEYEAPYEYDTEPSSFRKYKPDFTIHQDGRKIYLEHWGINRNGSVAHFFKRENESQEDAKERYKDKMDWACDMHSNHNTDLIQTTSYEFTENTVFKNLAQRLKENGIILKRLTNEEIIEFIKKESDDEYRNLIKLIQTFISLMKSNNYTLDLVKSKIRSIKNNIDKKRAESFIKVFEPIYKKYVKFLIKREEIDFADMINKATDYITNGQYIPDFKYILVDEFQDISINRYKLIKAIKDLNPYCKLFAVGDDWQSIYRFTGSDIGLFKDIETYFGYTEKLKIETTYRFCEPLISISSNFITKNENQSQKNLRNNNGEQNTIITYKETVDEDYTDSTFTLISILDELIEKHENIEELDILFLGRYKLDFSRIKNKHNFLNIDKKNKIISYQKNEKILNVKFMTIHTAKGLQADIVILVNCSSGKYGLPSGMSDDSILNLLLSEADQFENGEERRVFYVALTRAKKEVYLAYQKNLKSKFIIELLDDNEQANDKCPYCVKGNLVTHTGVSINGDTYIRQYCDNFSYGCDYSNFL